MRIRKRRNRAFANNLDRLLSSSVADSGHMSRVVHNPYDVDAHSGMEFGLEWNLRVESLFFDVGSFAFSKTLQCSKIRG
jgi:hypothetical protein